MILVVVIVLVMWWSHFFQIFTLDFNLRPIFQFPLLSSQSISLAGICLKLMCETPE